DHTVDRSVMDALAGFYALELPAKAIHYVKHPEAGHAMISEDDSQANACATSESPYINHCQNLDAAGELLHHLLGKLQPKGTWLPDNLVAFDQRPFVGGKPADISMADEGYAYIPTSCRGGGCRVHVAFHGCRQGTGEIGQRFVDSAGYNAWAESNRLIILYPQVIARSGLPFMSVVNPKGCWDWWGYTGGDYYNRNGHQIRAVKAMIERLGEPVSHTISR
ncbi:MAG: hypothetical protein J0626_09915, partial [Rhodospirillaceae bacterium]|nr:hypothetical protein [Rhodospirillaceae bacterium]